MDVPCRGGIESLKGAVQVKLYGKSVVIPIPKPLASALGMEKPMRQVEVRQYKSTALLDNNHYHYIGVK